MNRPSNALRTTCETQAPERRRWVASLALLRCKASFLTIVALISIGQPEARASVVTESLDADFNYELKFGAMPEPKPAVVHSRVERETGRRLLWVFPLSPRNLEWEFELVAAPSWVEVLKRDFLAEDWNEVEPRGGLPDWFSPTPEGFSVWYLPSTSGIHGSHLFIERKPEDPQRVRVFIRRH
jgi:hypothetical protein